MLLKFFVVVEGKIGAVVAPTALLASEGAPGD
jgi:hypothetical protein